MRWFFAHFIVALTLVSANGVLTTILTTAGFWVLYVLLVWWLSRLTKEWFPKTRISPDKKAVLITGCDRGFGHAIAKQLCNKGYFVFAACLFPEGEGAKELKTAFPRNLHVIEIDVTNQDHVNKAVQQVKKTLGDNGKVLWAVINNAGIAISAEAEWGGIDQYQRQMDVNVTGVVRVTQAFLPLLRKSEGRVILVASAFGKIIVPAMVSYGMSKAAIVAFADGLRREMIKWNVQVISIEPSLYRTTITSPDYLSKTLESAWEKTPQDVREEYGNEYFKGYRRLMMAAVLTSRPHVHEVVDCMDDAVTSTNPKSTYPCYGFLESVRFWFFRNMPSGFLDYVASTVALLYTKAPEARTEMATRRLQTSSITSRLKQAVSDLFFNISAHFIENVLKSR